MLPSLPLGELFFDFCVGVVGSWREPVQRAEVLCKEGVALVADSDEYLCRIGLSGLRPKDFQRNNRRPCKLSFSLKASKSAPVLISLMSSEDFTNI